MKTSLDEKDLVRGSKLLNSNSQILGLTNITWRNLFIQVFSPYIYVQTHLEREREIRDTQLMVRANRNVQYMLLAAVPEFNIQTSNQHTVVC